MMLPSPLTKAEEGKKIVSDSQLSSGSKTREATMFFQTWRKGRKEKGERGIMLTNAEEGKNLQLSLDSNTREVMIFFQTRKEETKRDNVYKSRRRKEDASYSQLRLQNERGHNVLPNLEEGKGKRKKEEIC